MAFSVWLPFVNTQYTYIASIMYFETTGRLHIFIFIFFIFFIYFYLGNIGNMPNTPHI